MVARELDKLSIPHIVFNQREFANSRIGFEMSNDLIKGKLQLKESISP
ncbi:MAG: hypothetical protein WA421_01720 [Nitrososphaeraceae archaeon]|jgi:hypothetical protein